MPLLEKIKTTYKLWYEYCQTLPKPHRYSLGNRIDILFIEIIEAISIASFSPKEEKRTYISIAIRKIDTLRVLLMVLWETKSLDNKKYIVLSLHIDEIGKMELFSEEFKKIRPAIPSFQAL